MTFLTPSQISISRPDADDLAGEQPYGGVQGANETVLISGIAAHIQLDRQGTTPVAKIPADAAGESIWKVIYKSRLARDIARTGDVITDQLGNRYQVIAADGGPLSTTCRCQILQA